METAATCLSVAMPHVLLGLGDFLGNGLASWDHDAK
jgi:hypothetical protein